MSDSYNPECISKSMETRRKFDFKFKETVLQYAEKTSGEQAARFFNIDPKRIRDWRKQRAKLLLADQRRARLTGGGRKKVSLELEKRLSQWIYSMREKQKRVSRKIIRAKALEIYPLVSDGGKTFVASRGWLQGFLQRNGLIRQSSSTTDQRDPNQSIRTPAEQSDIASTPNDLKNIIIKEEQQEWSPALELESTEPQRIKEEQQELWSRQEGEQLQGLEEAETIKFPFTPVHVRIGDGVNHQSSQFPQRPTEQTETGADDGEDCGGLESARDSDSEINSQSETEVKTEDTFDSDTDNSEDDWKETVAHQSVDECKREWKTCSDAFVKNKKQKNLLSNTTGGTKKEWEYDTEINSHPPHEQSRSSRNTLQLQKGGSLLPPTVEKQLLDIIRQPLTTPAPHVPSQDEEMFYFALSLVPQLNRLSRATQTQAKIHILAYLAGLEAQEQGQLPPQRPLTVQSSNQQPLNPPPATFHTFQHTSVYQQGQPTEPPLRADQQGSQRSYMDYWQDH
ncbi:uncharacterized protein LOC121510985 [Cheilinus undulatus]|uniref:uncharacterized protein LOC121510985 n=1 Tax=Cheilinus undulatus TaxID=241271 RepID=UPI001BD37B35|nr:uncharacterized protein LOC121510985 [Cheilinus undulatus]